MKAPNPSRIAGTTLLEVLGYIVIIGVLVNLCASIFVANLRLSALGVGGLDKMNQLEDIREGFTRDVRSASRICPRLGSYQSGPDQLVLEVPARREDGAARRYVVYTSSGSPVRLVRLGGTEQVGGDLAASVVGGDVTASVDGEFIVDYCQSYPRSLQQIRFDYAGASPPDARLVHLELVGESPQSSRVQARYTFAVALRGIQAQGGS